MRYEKIINRVENPVGDRISFKIIIYCSIDYSEFKYNTIIEYKNERKRKWFNVTLSNRWNKIETETHRQSKHLFDISEDEIYQAKLEAWEQLKPVRENGRPLK